MCRVCVALSAATPFRSITPQPLADKRRMFITDSLAPRLCATRANYIRYPQFAGAAIIFQPEIS